MNRWLTRHTVMTLMLMGLVAALYWFVNRDPLETIDEPMELPGVDRLDRVEIMPPPGEETPDLVAMERRGERWWLVRPREARMDPDLAGRLEEILGTPTATDDVTMDVSRADSVGLDDDRAVRVSAFGAGDERPALELLVGDGLEVPETGARRTFVRVPEEDTIYRARADFSELVRALPEELVETARVDSGEQ